MPIQTVEDPITGDNIHLVKGPITAIYINKLKSDVIGNDPAKGTSWHFTHNINFLIDGERISGGLLNEDKLYMRGRVKGAGDKEYKELLRGMVVTAKLKKGKPYKNKSGDMVETWNTSASQVTITDDSGAIPNDAQGGASSAPQAASQPAGKRDNSGMIAGNGFNAAKAFLKGKPPKSAEDMVALSKELIDIGSSLREKLKVSNPALSDYEVGARVGMVLIAACEWSKTIKDVEFAAVDALDNMVEPITTWVKSGGDETPKASTNKAPDPFDEDVPESVTEEAVGDDDDPFA